ncbi:cytochrome C oxidase subunit II [Rhizobium tubonense]|uniref:Cytochrome C oxidase subunit II n=2 Tax=Rhizobium tubonense TaxID=484088 RepID=A0A2W4CTL7_9HYPH|nr:cytochrome C oxidase subunit II [Rhizobium tubonense]
MAAYAGVHQATMPQSQVETIDPVTLHMSGEFVETNLGSAVEPDGSVTVRVVAQQYSFAPSCILVPADTKITMRGTSADVVHGLLIEQTNVNAMLVPGYISQLTTRFDKAADHLMPCQEFCSVGHEGMWAKVKVIDREQFMATAAGQRRISCVK